MNAPVIKDLEGYVLMEYREHKTTIQQLQQVFDNIENLKLYIINETIRKRCMIK